MPSVFGTNNGVHQPQYRWLEPFIGDIAHLITVLLCDEQTALGIVFLNDFHYRLFLRMYVSAFDGHASICAISCSVVAFSGLHHGRARTLYTCGNIRTHIPACVHLSGCQIMVNSSVSYFFVPILSEIACKGSEIY